MFFVAGKRVLTCGNDFPISYYGRSCHLVVSKIVDERGGSEEAEDSFVQSFEHLSLEAKGKKSDTQDEPLKLERQEQFFVEISPETRITIVSQSSPSDKKTVSLQQIGGLDSQIQTLLELIKFATTGGRNPVFGHIPTPRGVLVYGPSGCGKSLLINAVAQDSGMFVVPIETSKIWTRFYGESETNLVSQFELAKKR